MIHGTSKTRDGTFSSCGESFQMVLFKKVYIKVKEKELNKIPIEILRKFELCIRVIEMEGIDVFRKMRGNRDEALIGKRKGQRSFRLNYAWRVIYTESSNGIVVVEITKHKY